MDSIYSTDFHRLRQQLLEQQNSNFDEGEKEFMELLNRMNQSYNELHNSDKHFLCEIEDDLSKFFGF